MLYFIFRLRTLVSETLWTDVCRGPGPTQAKPPLPLLLRGHPDEKEARPSCFPEGGLPLVCRWRSSHCIPLLCLRRQVGRWAAGQGSWLGNGYLRATGKVSHLRITHMWESGCPFMLCRSKWEPPGRWAGSCLPCPVSLWGWWHHEPNFKRLIPGHVHTNTSCFMWCCASALLWLLGGSVALHLAHMSGHFDQVGEDLSWAALLSLVL